MKKYLRVSCCVISLILIIICFGFFKAPYFSNFDDLDAMTNNDKLINLSNMSNYEVQNKYIETNEVDHKKDKLNQIINEIESSSLESNKKITNLKEKTINGSKYFYTSGYNPSNNFNKFKTTKINDDIYDTRTKVELPYSPPYGATGKVVSTFYNVFNKELNEYHTVYMWGTGFMVKPKVLLTAAHCIFTDITTDEYDDGIFNPKYADKIEFYAGLNGEVEENDSFIYYSVAEQRVVLPAYEEDLNVLFDMGVVVLDRDIGYQTGWYGLVSNYKANSEIYSFGYPAEKNSTMWESNGQILGLLDEYRYATTVYATQGQSGSAYLIDYTEPLVCGILTAGLEDKNNQLQSVGVRINIFIVALVNWFYDDSNCEKVATIKPADYGFADAYPTDETTKTSYITHNLESGFTFETRRYRTGFIQNEYIVMSPFRSGINEAFIQYNFMIPIAKIEVDLTHWRSLSQEWTYSSECSAVIRTIQDDYYETVFDLLSEEANLPTDRTNPTTYTIVFPTPVYSFEFHMFSNRINTNDNNRGRLCIGNLTLYSAMGEI